MNEDEEEEEKSKKVFMNYASDLVVKIMWICCDII